MTKNDVKCLQSLLSVAAGSIAAVKGDFKTPDRMNISRMRSLINHWQDAGKEILKILESEIPQQQETFEDQRPIMVNLDDPESLVTGRITIDPAKVTTNGAGKEEGNNN